MLLCAAATAMAIILIAPPTVGEPIYLHVFGTMVRPRHDIERPDDSPTNLDDRPWVRTATVRVFDGQSFGMFTPNDRQPSIAIDGNLQRTRLGTYKGTIHFLLDDSNLTYDQVETIDLPLEQVVYLDPYYNCYVLSADDDPYEALTSALGAKETPVAATVESALPQ